MLKGASLLVDAVITQTGYSGQTVTLDVEDDGRIVGSQKVQLPVDGSPATVRVRATATEPGPRVFTFKVAPQQGEVVTQNNQRDSLVDVRDMREKILYFEGEPRSEMKFIRRAVADDKNLQIVTLQRTADNKFLRLDVDTPDELLGGFPKTRDELFAFKGLILGSIEAAAFSADQLQMIADFVDRRGGGLLMLGGARSFAEGGYGGTPVADALPLLIDPRTRAAEPTTFARLKVMPTRAGEAHAVTQIAGSEEASAKRWPELPQVTMINAPLPIKPAATVLLNGTDERGRTDPGARLAAVRPWQEHRVSAAGLVGVADARQHPARGHDAREPVASDAAVARRRCARLRSRRRTTIDRVEPGEAVTIEASVVDPTWLDLNDAHVMARVTRPGGSTLDVPLQWTGERDGQYRGTFVSTVPGAYEIAIDRRSRRQTDRHATPRTCARRRGRQRVLRSDDARGAAAANRGRDGRTVLYARQRRRAGGGRQLRGARRDIGRGARALEHADHSDHAGRASSAPSGATAARSVFPDGRANAARLSSDPRRPRRRS